MMSRRNRRNKPEPVQPQEAPQPVVEPAPAPTVDAALLKRLAALEATVTGPDLTPAGRHNARVRKEQQRTTRPAGPGPVDRCPACGTTESSTGWRLAEATGFGWCCTACADVLEPPFVRGSRRIPNAAQRSSLLASAYLGIEPVWWLETFGARHGLTWGLATDPSAGPRSQKPYTGTGAPWSHIADTDRWREVARLAERRFSVGMGALPAVDVEAYLKPSEIQWRRQYDVSAGVPRMAPVEVPPQRPDPNTPERLAVEAAIVDELLKARRRKAKEAEAAAAEKSRQAEIKRHYREHAARLEREIERQRAGLRQDLRTALGKGEGR